MFNDLISELDSLGFEVFAYADDLAVIIESSAQRDTLLDIAEQWAERSNMRINKKKSAFIKLQKKRGARSKTGSSFRDYPIKKEYKYLGVMIDERLNFNGHCK